MDTIDSVNVNNTTRLSEQSPRLLQNFLCVWLDDTLQESNDDFQRSAYYLRKLLPSIAIFRNVEECIDYISEFPNEKVFIIVSGLLGRLIAEEIKLDTWSQIDSIYIFCHNASIHEIWAKRVTKIKGLFSRIEEICKVLHIERERCEQSLIPISFRGIDPTFIYSQLLRDTFLEIDEDDSECIKEFADFCRHQNYGTAAEIERFEKEYHANTPIWWYTASCLLYSMVNRSLRTLEIDILLKMRFFIRDLHRNIQQMYNEQKSSYQQFTAPFQLYRGQSLTIRDFEKLKRSIGRQISFNCFLSTSVSREISLELFARGAPIHDPNLVGVLFVIKIDVTMADLPETPFANVAAVGQFEQEKEVLFTTNTVFHIQTIEKLPDSSTDRLWQVDLTLTDQKDEEWQKLAYYTTQEIQSNKSPWIQLANIVLKLGHATKAEEMYQTVLQHMKRYTVTENFNHTNSLLTQQQASPNEASSSYPRILCIGPKSLSSNERDLATCYNSIARAHRHTREYSKVLSFSELALDIQKKCLPENDVDFATSYANIAMGYLGLWEYSKAISAYERVLDIQTKCLPSNHPDFGFTYNNIGLAYYGLGEYTKAISSYERALDIATKTLPSNHPHIAPSYGNIGNAYLKIGEYSKALSFFERALHIRKQSLPSNHPDFSASYKTFGIVYLLMGEHAKALSYFLQVLDIETKDLSSNHPDLAVSYNNLGLAYLGMGDHSKALSSWERALDILTKSLPVSRPLVEMVLRSMDSVTMTSDVLKT